MADDGLKAIADAINDEWQRRQMAYIGSSTATYKNRPTRAGVAAEEIARLRAEVETLRADCASISEEMGLPPTMRWAEGEIRRLREAAQEAGKLRAEVERLAGLVAGYEAGEDRARELVQEAEVDAVHADREMERLRGEVERLERERDEAVRQLKWAQANNHQRNVELDALHYVWCSGGCEGGVHRFNALPPITDEIVSAAIRNTERLVSWWRGHEYRKDASHGAYRHVEMRQHRALLRCGRWIRSLLHERAEDKITRDVMRACVAEVADLRSRLAASEAGAARMREAIVGVLSWREYESDHEAYKKEHGEWVPLLPWRRLHVALAADAGRALLDDLDVLQRDNGQKAVRIEELCAELVPLREALDASVTLEEALAGKVAGKAIDKLRALLEEVADLNASADLRHDADERAIKRWHEAHPGHALEMPDHADMVVGLIGDRDRTLDQSYRTQNADRLVIEGLRAEVAAARAEIVTLAEERARLIVENGEVGLVLEQQDINFKRLIADLAAARERVVEFAGDVKRVRCSECMRYVTGANADCLPFCPACHSLRVRLAALRTPAPADVLAGMRGDLNALTTDRGLFDVRVAPAHVEEVDVPTCPTCGGIMGWPVGVARTEPMRCLSKCQGPICPKCATDPSVGPGECECRVHRDLPGARAGRSVRPAVVGECHACARWDRDEIDRHGHAWCSALKYRTGDYLGDDPCPYHEPAQNGGKEE